MIYKPQKRILIIAGPNGAGKTTLARELLPNEAETSIFINADLLAAGLDPLQPDRAAIQAGRMMLQMIDACVSSGRQFRFRDDAERKGLRSDDPALAGPGLLGYTDFPQGVLPRGCNSPS